MRAGEVAQALAAQADSVAAYLLPNGKRQGREWCAGSVSGEHGESLKVCIHGQKAGTWSDFAAGGGGDLIDLWAACRGLSLGEAIRDAKAYLGIREQRIENPRREFSKPSREGVTKLPPQIEQWLVEVRRISAETIARFKLASRKGALMFPYLRDGQLVSAKYRKVPAKEFFVDADCEPCLFGWQAFPESARAVVICEGEMDALAFAEYGVPALSVPFGGGEKGKQSKWIDCEFDRVAHFDQIFLALDSDDEGRKATAEIVKRLGRERCRVVTLPHKDANECLLRGVPKEEIVIALAESRTMDPEQLRSAADYADELEREFSDTEKPEVGISLPWRKADGLVLLRPGELSIWAGYSGHGKTEATGNVVIGALCDDWRACVASMEFRPVKWLKRIVRQTTAQATPSVAYVRHVAQWFRDRLWVFDVTGNAKGSAVLECFIYAAKRYGVKLFVIDNLAKCGFAEDDYNGQKQFVDALTDFAKAQDVHVALVCHMRKTDAEEKPGGKMDIKGTGGITDMADTVITVWRNKPKEKSIRAYTREQADKLPHERKDIAEEITSKPDCIIQVTKQRNGEHEPVLPLWFDRASHQFTESPRARPKAFVGFSVVQRDEIPI